MKMTDQAGPGNQFRINPSGIPGKKFSDVSQTGIFGAHTVNASSVRQATWARYAGFLTGNVIMFAFSGIPGIEHQLLGPFCGCLLCYFWYKMLETDRDFLISRFDEAGKFRWSGLPPEMNLFVTMRRGDDAAFGDVI